jgi:hypothetical protein
MESFKKNFRVFPSRTGFYPKKLEKGVNNTIKNILKEIIYITP